MSFHPFPFSSSSYSNQLVNSDIALEDTVGSTWIIHKVDNLPGVDPQGLYSCNSTAVTQCNISCLAKTLAKHYFARNQVFGQVFHLNDELISATACLRHKGLLLPACGITPDGTLAFLHKMVFKLLSLPP